MTPEAHGILIWRVPPDVHIAMPGADNASLAAGLRHHFIEWRERQTERDQAQAAIDAAKSEHQRRQDRLDGLNEKIADHIGHVEDRDLRNVNLNELIATAVKAVTDGYNEGTAINVGRVVGAGGVR